MTRQSLVLGLLIAVVSSFSMRAADAQWIVNDPQNAIILVAQRLNQLKQIENQITSLEYQLRNLRAYAQNWQQIRSELDVLRAAIAQSRPKFATANAQLAQMD